MFGKYDQKQVIINDPGLAKYINLDPIYVLHTGAKNANRKFGKSKINIVERLPIPYINVYVNSTIELTKTTLEFEDMNKIIVIFVPKESTFLKGTF